MAGDIDIDFPDRNKIVSLINCVPAQKRTKNKIERHNSGVHIQPIPYDPIHDCAAIYYKDADDRGYFKLDLLNVKVYQYIRDEEHYQELMNREPPWHRLAEHDFVKQLIQISNYPEIVAQHMPDSIPRMAILLAAIRPGKRHLLGKSWNEMAKTIWDKCEDAYVFKKSHSVSYAVLVALHMNIIDELDNKSKADI